MGAGGSCAVAGGVDGCGWFLLSWGRCNSQSESQDHALVLLLLIRYHVCGLMLTICEMLHCINEAAASTLI